LRRLGALAGICPAFCATGTCVPCFRYYSAHTCFPVLFLRRFGLGPSLLLCPLPRFAPVLRCCAPLCLPALLGLLLLLVQSAGEQVLIACRYLGFPVLLVLLVAWREVSLSVPVSLMCQYVYRACCLPTALPIPYRYWPIPASALGARRIGIYVGTVPISVPVFLVCNLSFRYRFRAVPLSESVSAPYRISHRYRCRTGCYLSVPVPAAYCYPYRYLLFPSCRYRYRRHAVIRTGTCYILADGTGTLRLLCVHTGTGVILLSVPVPVPYRCRTGTCLSVPVFVVF